jgi:hypothetical protein
VDAVDMYGFNHPVITALLQTLPRYFECRRLKLPEHLHALGPTKQKKPKAVPGVDGRTKVPSRSLAKSMAHSSPLISTLSSLSGSLPLPPSPSLRPSSAPRRRSPQRPPLPLPVGYRRWR